MTNTEAFNKAMEMIEKAKDKEWNIQKPVEAFLTPIRVIWMWIRICDYYVVNSKLPKSYRSLHAWEKKYYDKNKSL